MKYIDYIEQESENDFLKHFYQNLYIENNYRDICPLIRMREQLKLLIGDTNLINRNNTGKDYYKSLKKKLITSFNNYWYELLRTDISMSNSAGGNKLRTYRKFKNSIEFEEYLSLNNPEKRKLIARFRLSSHKLKIESGRYNSRNMYVAPEQRLCDKCTLNKTEDEYHFLIECPFYQLHRNKLFNEHQDCNTYFASYSKYNQFIWILTCDDFHLLNALGDFLANSLKLRGI